MSLKPNEIKIMTELKAINMEVCSKDLASMTNIHPQSIGRYIKALKEMKLVKTHIKQLHNKRFNMIALTKEGKKTEYAIPKKPKKPKIAAKKTKEIINSEFSELHTQMTDLVKKMLLDEFELVKSFMRKGLRPTQQKAIENFENHLKELI